MPIYDYRCEDCRKECEIVVLDASAPLCPSCGSAKLTKLLSVTAAPGRSQTFIKNARKVAAAQGHFSHYKRSERPRT